jgi:endonuclease/exonuclease/phosphatase family metal-dependent hydrolase
LGILIDASLGRLQLVGDDRGFRHGRDWKHWLAGRVELFRPGTSSISFHELVIVVNHWDSMKRGMRDTMANREILAWEVGSWMCSRDRHMPQVLVDPDTKQPVPVYRQPSLAMGDFNCEPGSPELRSARKFTLQAMRNQPDLWPSMLPESKMELDAHALLYDLSWRKLTASATTEVPGMYPGWGGFHSPAMIDRMLVSRALWDGTQMRIVLDDEGQAMRIIPAVEECSDHSAIAITVETK